MNKPMPEHHRAITIARSDIAKGYGVILNLGKLGRFSIVAAAPVDAANPPPADMVRVIVAPARGPK